jgi:hypothetical protein
MLVAACSSSATPAPAATPAAAASAAASAAPSAEPSAAPSASPEASMAPEASTAPGASLAIPSFTLPNQDTNLEALLPSTFGGVKLQKFSMKGEQYLSQGSGTQLDAAMSGLGLTAADLSVAVAADPANATGITFLAIRFAGADSGKLQQVFLAAAQASGDYLGSVSVGGKNVIKSKDTAGTSFSYFYVKNDTVLGVTAKDDATAAPALALLP